MITIKETTYKNFGKCLSLCNDSVEVLVTIDIGPRIIKCNLIGRDNLMFEDIERKKVTDVSSLYGAGKQFYNYGGHRMWFSPEKFPDTYYPDTEKVVYSVNPTGASFEAPVQAITGLQFSISITMDESAPRFTVVQSVKNTQKKEVTGALWGLSVMDKNGVVIVPQPKDETGLLPNRNLVLWPYTKMSDERFYVGDEYIALRQAFEAPTNLKFGINNTAGKSAYVKDGQALVKDVPHLAGEIYPDGGCSFESYSGDLFIEAESLSPLKTLGHGESIVHTEEWALIPDVTLDEMNEDTLAAVGEKLFK